MKSKHPCDNESIMAELQSFRKLLLDEKVGVLTGDDGVLAHLRKLNGQVGKNTRFIILTKGFLKAVVVIMGGTATLAGITIGIISLLT